MKMAARILVLPPGPGYGRPMACVVDPAQKEKDSVMLGV